MRTDELYAQKKDEPSISELPLVSDRDSARQGQCFERRERIFTIRRPRAALECPTFPVTLREFRAPEVCLAAILDCRTIHGTRWVLQEMSFKNPPAQERISPSLPSDPNNLGSSYCEGVPGICHETWRRIETRTAEFNNTDSSYSKNLFSKLYDGSSEVCHLGISFRKVPRPR